MKITLTLFKLLISALGIVVVLRYVGSDKVLQTLLDVSLWPMLAGIGLIVLSSGVAAWRWCWIVKQRGGSLQFLPGIRLIYESLFFNQLLPSMIGGDAVRVVRAASSSNLTLSLAFRSVVIDRATGLLALLFFAAAAIVIATASDIPIRSEVLYASGLMMLLGLGGVIALVVLSGFLGLALHKHVPKRLRRAFDQLLLLGRDFVQLNSSLWRFLVLNGLGVTVHIVVVLATFCLGLSLGIDKGFSAYLIAVPISILVSALPISIAGWGVREAMMVAAFSMTGVPPEAALAVSLLFGASLALLGIAGGIFFLMRNDRLPVTEEAAVKPMSSQADA